MANPREATIAVRGYSEFLRAISLMPKEIQKDLRGALREAGEAVRKDAAVITGTDLGSRKSAQGYRTIVRARGISVEQSLRKTTGLRPKWGALQMVDSLIPALEENEPGTERLVENAMQDVVDFFEREARWRKSGLLPIRRI